MLGHHAIGRDTVEHEFIASEHFRHIIALRKLGQGLRESREEIYAALTVGGQSIARQVYRDLLAAHVRQIRQLKTDYFITLQYQQLTIAQSHVANKMTTFVVAHLLRHLRQAAAIRRESHNAPLIIQQVDVSAVVEQHLYNRGKQRLPVVGNPHKLHGIDPRRKITRLLGLLQRLQHDSSLRITRSDTTAARSQKGCHHDTLQKDNTSHGTNVVIGLW